MASPKYFSDKVEKQITLIGGHVSPTPKPCIVLAQATSENVILISNVDIYKPEIP